jgi:hypothetical protein
MSLVDGVSELIVLFLGTRLVLGRLGILPGLILLILLASVVVLVTVIALLWVARSLTRIILFRWLVFKWSYLIVSLLGCLAIYNLTKILSSFVRDTLSLIKIIAFLLLME